VRKYVWKLKSEKDLRRYESIQDVERREENSKFLKTRRSVSKIDGDKSSISSNSKI